VCTAFMGRPKAAQGRIFTIINAENYYYPASNGSEDYSKAMCCSCPTSQYFQKNDDWTVRRRAPGVHDFNDIEPWSCNNAILRQPGGSEDPGRVYINEELQSFVMKNKSAECMDRSRNYVIHLLVRFQMT